MQIYGDDIIFGLKNTKKCHEFEMSMMRELNFFYGLQIKQSHEGIFVCQSKYTLELVDKFGLSCSKDAKVSMSPSCKLEKDEDGKSVDQKLYRSMIGKHLVDPI